MLQDLKRFGKETLVYGLSTVVGRLLNVLLLPLYTHYMAPAEYGVAGTVFAYLAFLNVVYAYGMDFAFMRLGASAGRGGTPRGFSTAFWSVAGSSAALSVLVLLFAGPLAAAAGLPSGASVLRCCALILAMDAVALVPFAELRLAHRPWAYAGIKTANIAANVGLTWLFLGPMRLGVEGVFYAAAAASATALLLLAPATLRKLEPAFDGELWKAFLAFGLPLIPAGLASMMVQVIDRPILKAMTDDATVGIYLANYKLGIFMQLVVNMFDAAWRPFILPRAEDPKAPLLMARVLTYFTLAGALVTLGVSLSISRIVALPLAAGRPLIHPDYWPGLSIVPVVLLGYLFNGVYVNFLAAVNLAKRNDLVVYGTALGAAVNVAANLLLIPRWGIQGAALATLAAYAAMAALMHVFAKRVFPVPYEYGRLAAVGGALAAAWGLALALGQGLGPGRAGLKLAIWLAMPAALAAGGFFDAEEKRALRGLWGAPAPKA